MMATKSEGRAARARADAPDIQRDDREDSAEAPGKASSPPTPEKEKKPWRPDGKHRELPKALKARMLQWPAAAQQRREVLDLWFYIAPQIAGPAVAATLLALRKVVMADSGSSWASNETIARWAGQLSLAKVKRDLALILNRGLAVSELGWREDANRKWRKTRTIFLAVPEPFPEGIQWPRSWSECDASTLEEELPRGAYGQGKTARQKQDNRLHVLTKEGLPRGAITLKGITSVTSEAFQDDASGEPNAYANATAVHVVPGVDDVPAASGNGDSPVHAAHGAAARPQRRASHVAPSIVPDLQSEK